MKIVAIEPVLCELPRGGGNAQARTQMLLVRVRTDAGLVGWGEAFAGAGGAAVARSALATLLAPRCIGRDPRQIQTLSREMLHHVHQLGRNGAVMHAWSGLETALWDLLAKSLAVPLHQLFGGAQVERIGLRAVVSAAAEPAAVERAVQRAAERGLRTVKLRGADRPRLRAAATALAQAPALECIVAPGRGWPLDEAIAVAQELRALPLRWLEDPLAAPEAYEQLARLRAAGLVPLASGAAVSSISDFHTLLRLDAVDVVQPHLAKLGGVGAARRVFDLAADTAVEVAPATRGLGPAALATLHLCAALWPRAELDEVPVAVGHPFAAALPADGAHLTVPTGPGLGCDPDPAALERWRVD